MDSFDELVNPEYLVETAKPSILRSLYRQTIPNIRLQNFLNPKLATKITSPEAVRDHQPGLHRRGVGKVPSDFTLFQNPGFLDFLERVVSTPLKFVSQEYQEFGPGDYSLLQEDENQGHRLVVKYDLTPEWNEDWGGFDLYTCPDTDPVVGHREFGALTLVRLEPVDRSCVKYINHLAGEAKVKLMVGLFHIVKDGGVVRQS